MLTRPVNLSRCWKSCSSETALAVGLEPLAGPCTALAVVPPWFAGPCDVLAAPCAKAGTARLIAAIIARAAKARRITGNVIGTSLSLWRIERGAPLPGPDQIATVSR